MRVEEILREQAQLLGFALNQITESESDLALCIGYINDAIEDLENYGDWTWLHARESIGVPTESEYVDLPLDFAAFLTSSFPFLTSHPGYPFDAVSHEEIDASKKCGTIETGVPMMYAPAFLANDDAESEPRHRLRIWPMALEIVQIEVPYKRRIKRVVKTGDVIQIPAALGTALKSLALANTEEKHENAQTGNQRAKAEMLLERGWAQMASPIRSQQRMCLRNLNRRGLASYADDHTPLVNVLPAED